ncbi:MAG: hypothetical protein M1834_003626 [Cirrosporium novae-zelandiae]|nr:MAG: hypothetical protein M1834_003626 [Cirrosporium novae-zelandiae]
MAPIRRYLRISKHSVLETRIYLDNPADASSRWLLNPRDPVLPRVIQSVRPLVLSKLREENEREWNRTKGKKAKAKGVKDVVVQDDFEVSIYLTEESMRHSVLTRFKTFVSDPRKLKSNSNKLTGDTEADPIELGDTAVPPVVLREESDDHSDGRVALEDIPFAVQSSSEEPEEMLNRRKRRRGGAGSERPEDTEASSGDEEDEEDDIAPVFKKAKMTGLDGDEKKKGMKTIYDGFAIYGRILCLVVKRTGGSRSIGGPGSSQGGGKAMMEEWITSTQVNKEIGRE